MDISLTLIDSIAEPGTVARGRAYFHDGRVHLEQIGDNHIRATIDGSDIYAVEIHYDAAGYDASCTCPFQREGKCKHIVATLLAAMYRNAKLEYHPRQLERKKREERATNWVQTVRPLLTPSASEPGEEQPDGAWRLVYSLKISGRRRSLHPVKLKLTKEGHDGQATLLRRYDLFGDRHFDSIDRLILERLTKEFSSTVPDETSVVHSEQLEDDHLWSMNDMLMGDVLGLLTNKELYFAHQNHYTFRRLHVSGEAARLNLSVSETNDGSIVLEPEVEWKGRIHPFPDDAEILSIDTLWILFGNNVVRLGGTNAAGFLAMQKLSGKVVVPPADNEEFMEDVLPRLVKRFRVRSELSSIKTIEADPIARLYMSEYNDKLNVQLRFLYSTVEVNENQGDTGDQNVSAQELLVEGGTFVYVQRNAEKESLLHRKLMESSLAPYVRQDGTKHYVPVIDPLEWLFRKLPVFARDGFEVFGQENLKKHRLRYDRPKVGIRVSSGIDWFDLNVDVTFEKSSVSFQAFVEAIRKNEQFVKLDDGTFGVLPEQWVKKFGRAVALGAAGDNLLKLSRTHIGLLGELSEGADEFESDEQFDVLRQRLQAFTSISQYRLPASFQGELRPYQKAGFDWLHFLREFGVGGILADDMGLGKTVQTLALLQHVYENGESLPSLVVVPTSPLFNWQKEIERFTPQLRILLYTGSERKQHLESFGKYHVIVTSYGILRRDVDVLKQKKFLYVVLDESQNIKNPVSINAQATRALNARHRLALSGTPVENNLNELWSQFAFLNPGMLGSERIFTEHFAKPIEKYADEQASAALKQMIFPFILRRTKDLVATELPPKVESVVYCEMDPEQKRHYDYWRHYYRESILNSIETIGFQKSRMKVLEGLMRLRQVCCHPLLVDVGYGGTSGKFDVFNEMLEDILAEEHKVLVFSQFVKMLTVLRGYCEKNSIVYEYLDGSTTNRKERVERFQSDDNVRLFLISLKAGGTGLNLTAADYVIHYDPWWNPAVEMQATDRTHRIGQTKQVFSYKLITRESVEEKILALQEKKKALVTSIITTDSGFMKTLTKEDVEALFS
ncbi:MAG: SNF2 helicase associated domain-containing protein [Bacteroidetes bacterium]|nr:SNF2 helicase associated domain-containing protein [Bacteroidota bacterium]MCW5893999.1 SNF2 helicase associated domain-containing protein [Bacteroidota bacterium]